ncbi:YcaO-like family protein [Streptomyces sp. NPDC088354]|uniref:YcaO-like family protein n=1 Tax=Streptomyces sp. NPDC088354 TaxID=3365856 RepID=UPI0038253E27
MVIDARAGRIRPPDRTWQIVQPILGKHGITRIADVTGLDRVGIPVYQAVRPGAHTLSVSQGKGVSHELARISAVMECIEFSFAEMDDPVSDGRFVASALDLALPYDALALPRSSRSVFSGRSLIEWIYSCSLSTGEKVPVPRETVYLRRASQTGRLPLFSSHTTGLASGNCYDEAVLHALYEIIERSSLSASKHAVLINPSTITFGTGSMLVDRIAEASVLMTIEMIENRFDVPCFRCFLWSDDYPVLAVGAGAHSSAEIALTRALTEAAQSRLAAIAGVRDDMRLGTLTIDQPSRRPALPNETVPWTDTFWSSSAKFGSLRAEVSHVTGLICDSLQSDLLVYDLSHGTEDISVVKVVVVRR